MTKNEWKKRTRDLILAKACFCYLCGKIIQKEKEMSLDHVTPLSRGGSDDEYNWKATHKDCNWKKGALTYEEFVQWKMLELKRNGKVR